jgi:type IV pilus secretin PilQ/predicted competence protein
MTHSSSLRILSAALTAALCVSNAAWAAETPVAPASATAAVSKPDATTMDERLKQTISVEYKDADLVSVLRSLALTYRLNLLTGPDIKGKVTINLQEITVERALEAILKANGLVYNKRDGVIYVNSGDSTMVDVATEVIQLKYLTATQAQNMTRKMLSPKGDMKINETANNLIVTDYSENIEKIRKLVAATDSAPQQVLIEAKILDITSTDLKSLGITMNSVYDPNKGGLFNRETKFNESFDGGLSLPTTNSTVSAGQLVLNTLTLKGISLTATIDALVRDGKANLLASPSIAVINGQEARIVIGERFPYKERTQTTSGTTETTKFVDIGTTLKVNPQINDDGYITLNLHPEVSSLVEALDAGPRVATREADTTVRIKAGETLVIGGLIRQVDNRTTDRVPILGDIPILGNLFKRDNKSWEQTELAVFITPRILFSREEQKQLGLDQKEIEKSYLLIDKTANASMVEKIYDMARNMDRGIGIESVRKDPEMRKLEALTKYEMIYKQFPESDRAAEAKYRAGVIEWKNLRDYKTAKNTFSTLITDHPKSEWADEARKDYEEMTLEMQEERMQAEAAMRHWEGGGKD